MVMFRLEEHTENPEDSAPVFKPGQIAQHRLYSYRGVVVDSDPECMADDSWYLSNQTQPSRNQPWYHVLVHGSDHSTYVAESNLEADSSGQPIEHPMLQNFFKGLGNEGYVRNTTPWPSL